MNIEIYKQFLKVLINSLNTGQVNHLGALVHDKFSVYKESGFSSKVPLPRQTAAETLLRYFNTDNDTVELFTFMLQHEGTRFYNTKLSIWRRDEFIRILKKYKWIYDEELMIFSLDPFYEREINLLKKIKIIDLRTKISIKDIIKDITEVSKKLKIQDLDWRVTMRLYDLDPQIGELIRKIIDLLLVRQKLQVFAYEIFTCLKELAINASKANYKMLFEKLISRPQGVTMDKDYFHYLRLFKSEIDENGNRRLIELARREDKFINLTFQSTQGSIEIWVTNNGKISVIEKQEILKRIGQGGFRKKIITGDDDDYAEGAGLGINLILSILKKYSTEKHPLKVIFYPDFIKIGFELKRSELEKEKENNSD